MTHKKDFETLCSVLVFYAVLFVYGITCPIKWLTGISCPGCGMTRAWISVIRFDFSSAFYYHPLFWLTPIFLYFILKKGRNKVIWYEMLIVMVLFVGTYLYRMFLINSDIVVCNPSEGMLMELVGRLFGG